MDSIAQLPFQNEVEKNRDSKTDEVIDIEHMMNIKKNAFIF